MVTICQKSGAKLKCFGRICVVWSCHSVTLLSKLVAATQSDIASGNNKCLKLTSNSIILKIKWGKISPEEKIWSRIWLLPSSQVNEFFADQLLSVCWKLLKPDLDFHKILFYKTESVLAMWFKQWQKWQFYKLYKLMFLPPQSIFCA